MTRITLKLPTKQAGDSNAETVRDPARKPVRSGGVRTAKNQPRPAPAPREEAPRRAGPRNEGPRSGGPSSRPDGDRPRRQGDARPQRQDADRAERRPRRDEGERPQGRSDRPAYPRSGEGQERYERPRRSDGDSRPPRPRDSRDGEAPRRPRRDDGEQRGEQRSSFRGEGRGEPRGERGQRGERGERGERSYGDRKPAGSFGKPRAAGGERPARREENGERPAYGRGRTDGEAPRRRSQDGERGFGERSYGERKFSGGFDKSRSNDERPARPRREEGQAFGERQRPPRGKPAGNFAQPPRRFDDAPRRPRAQVEDTEERSDSYGGRGNPSELPRLSKVMSEQGLCSRREADEWIEQGWVKVDGKVVSELGSRISPKAHIEIDQTARQYQAQSVTILLHKPIGYVSGQAEDGYEPAVVLVKPENHWEEDKGGTRFKPAHLRRLAPAGRLDIDSTGLLVLTQDGRVAKRLIGDDSTVEKEYLVRVEGELVENGLEMLNHGLSLDGVKLKRAHVSWQNEEQLRFVLREGRKRQIRRMCELVGLRVVGLKRIRIGSVVLGKLPPGQWRYLRDDEKF